jgi:signal transduction histidine kinase
MRWEGGPADGFETGPIRIATKSFAAGAAHPELKAGNYIRLSVTDTGEGMEEETLRQAREPFLTTKGIGKGTGLGLSMVHGLAEQSGGALLLKSAL